MAGTGQRYDPAMGEIQRHHVTHHASPRLEKMLGELIAAFAATAEAPQPDVEPDDYSPVPTQPHVEWWTFHDPRQACEVAAFLDPDNQVRHVPVSRIPEAPKAWRPIYLGDTR